MSAAKEIVEILAIDAEARRLERERLSSLKIEDITEEDLDTVEGFIGMGRGAWDMVDHRELVLACVKTVCMKVETT